ncbi:MAG: TlpA family protein disulfide reductase [Oscillospiraceae bacterium]|nr:TlpA family protein disulfide reductase [Oscillospiraceae bacterium]
MIDRLRVSNILILLLLTFLFFAAPTLASAEMPAVGEEDFIPEENAAYIEAPPEAPIETPPGGESSPAANILEDSSEYTNSIFNPTMPPENAADVPYVQPSASVLPAATGYAVGDIASAEPAITYSRDEVLQYMHDETAPNFSLQTTSGSWLQLSDCSGRTVLLIFWTSLTSDSLDSLEQLRSVSSRYPNVQIITVNSLPEENNHAQWTEQAFFEHIAWINGYFNERGYRFPVLLDVNGEVSNMSAYRADRLPMTFFIDGEGVIRIPWTGRLTSETLDTLLSMMTALDG